MAKRTKSSQLWLERQRRDPYVKKARIGRSRFARALQTGAARRALFTAAPAACRCSNSVRRRAAGRVIWPDVLREGRHRLRWTIGRCRFRAASSSCVSTSTPTQFERCARRRTWRREGRPCFVGYVPQHQWSEGSGSGRGDGSDRAGDGRPRCDGWNRVGALVVKMFQGEGIDEWIKDMRRVLCESDAREARGVALRVTRGLCGCDGIHGHPRAIAPSRWPAPTDV